MLNRKLFLLLITSLISNSLLANTLDCQELSIPIEFDPQGLPLVELNINDVTHKVLLDIGSSEGIHLPVTEIVKIPEVKYTGTSVKSSNIKGEVFDAKAFVISSLKINCATFTNMRGLELAPWAASIGEGNVDEAAEQIVIGRGFFKGKKITINYSDKTLIIKNSSNKVTSSKAGNYTMPYRINKEGISIEMTSPNANYQMILDTGASNSIFVANKVSLKESLTTCDYNLGPNVKCEMYDSSLKVFGHDFQSSILLFPIDERFKMDGILGSDFFNNFIVEIDFLKKSIALTPINNKVEKEATDLQPTEQQNGKLKQAKLHITKLK